MGYNAVGVDYYVIANIDTINQTGAGPDVDVVAYVRNIQTASNAAVVSDARIAADGNIPGVRDHQVAADHYFAGQ